MDINLNGMMHLETAVLFWYKIRREGTYYVFKKHPRNGAAALEKFMRVFDVVGELTDTGGAVYNDVLYLDAEREGSLRIEVHESALAKANTIIDSIEDFHRYIHWYYKDGTDMESKKFVLSGPMPKDEFYPWLDRPIAALAKNFLASSANAFVLIGPPGTGKTSFIRGLADNMDAEIWLTYDESLHNSDALHTKFMSPSPTPRLLILEDADVLLSAQSDGNRLMSRLLNLSDGLVSTGKRKIIFSTNLPSVRSVDEALLRPGRCFGVIHFRELTRVEAQAACRAIGTELAVNIQDNETIPLAVALNGKNAHDPVVLQMGFVK